MNRFNDFMHAHFRNGCRLIAKARDTCRNRDVQLYAIPGYWDVVGVSDGVDAWIAPASAGLFFGTATGDCAEIMRRLKAGEALPPVPEARRPRVHLEDDMSDLSDTILNRPGQNLIDTVTAARSRPRVRI